MVKRLVNFRLPEGLLEQLRERSELEQVTVTELLIRYCAYGLQHYVGTDVKTVNTTDTFVRTTDLYRAINEAVLLLQQQIEEVKAELEKYIA